jgi:hypothetical protein
MASADIRELRNLPLSDLITAPLNAVIEAQANSAMSTAQFIEQVGFSSEGEASFFDDDSKSQEREIRTAELKVKKKLLKTADDGTTSVEIVDEFVSIPFITLFNIPSIEIQSLDWDFNVKLKSMQSLETSYSQEFKYGYRSKTEINAGIAAKIFSAGINTSMTVESTFKSDFELRHKAGREQEYNLHINIKAVQAQPPKGIERLLAIAERVATESEAANAHEAAES